MKTPPFRWTHCYADVLAHRYVWMAQPYVRDVVTPSLSQMDRRIADMRERSDDPAAVFGIQPAEELRRATLLGYCLSLQALWEKQLRGYLSQCAIDLKREPATLRSIERADWQGLNALFQQLRGVYLRDFIEYKRLDQLYLLGNVCRHGEGGSVHRLVASHPELWVKPTPILPPPPGPPFEFVRTAGNLHMELPLLEQLAAAVDSFWSEVVYLYNESIEGKHESLERQQALERAKRAGRGCPWDPPLEGTAVNPSAREKATTSADADESGS